MDSTCIDMEQVFSHVYDPKRHKLLIERKMRILAAEDDKLFNHVLTKALHEFFHPDSHVYLKGLEVIDHWNDPEKPLPDTILLDIVMRHSSGDEIIRDLKNLYDCDLPSGALTGNATACDIERLPKAALDQVFGKPYKKKDLREVVLKLVLGSQNLSIEQES